MFVDPATAGPTPAPWASPLPAGRSPRPASPLAIGTALLADLRAHGYTVVMARTAGGAVAQAGLGDVRGRAYSAAGHRRDLQARAACANVGHADVLVSVHPDAFPDPAARGSETVYDPDRPFAGQSLRLARLVRYDVGDFLAAAGWSVPDRGVLDDLQQGTAVDAAAMAYGHLLLLGPPVCHPQPITQPDARRGLRTAVHHRPVRGRHRHQPSRAAGTSPGTDHRRHHLLDSAPGEQRPDPPMSWPRRWPPG